MKQLAAAGDHDKITAVINLLVMEFTYSPQANHRKVAEFFFFFFKWLIITFNLAEYVLHVI